ncbi:extracellular solute-binding protein [Deinococcus cellulosilyticus]|uniref:ABC transporter substrate-binding protein n=1 Tax=Deinococcus cellulosilyticus (strain DSM 18568 / NBRC 106333 / KACC 11606 / 5516J-15) TaxID=1223518 RepID=A0A511N0Z3_DEIC1|nr:extracellular solute-binding protein [Deinococcus cellulosilyticus]GEM46469.1 ABC transporter substrate-binding protein [Deinococcus cellulosilyticus NBRC 106333 = KACC 11606]
MKRLSVLMLLLLGAAQAKTEIKLWHYLSAEPAPTLFNQFAAEFNKSQDDYVIRPEYAGGYKEMDQKIIAGLRANNTPPALLVDNAFFVRLMQSGQLKDLDKYTGVIPESLSSDIYPVAWNMGKNKEGRFGLPWAASSMLMFFNGAAFKAKNVALPDTWPEFYTAAQKLTSRGTSGVSFITESWIFASMVYSQGGDLVKDNKPNLLDPVVIESLQQLVNLKNKKALIPRATGEVQNAVIDFLRTKTFMVVAPSSAFPLAFKNPNYLSLQVSAYPLPGSSIAGESQLAVMKSASDAQTKGVMEFWKFLLKPDNLRKWSTDAYYVPVRKSVAKQVMNDPILAAAVKSFERSQNLPAVPQLDDWRLDLEIAIEKALKGNVPVEQALKEAQQNALK